MKTGEVLRFAWGSMLGARLRSALIVTAVAIGVAGVLLLTWLGDAARQYVTGQFASLGTNLVIVLPGRTETKGGAPPLMGETPRDLTIDDALAVGRSRHIKHVAPVIVGNASVSFERRDREVTIIGTTPEMFTVRNLELSRGRIWRTPDPRAADPVCVLGSGLSTELFGAHSPVGEWLRIGDRRFRVLGVLASSGRSLGLDLHDMALVPVGSAEMLFDSPALFRILCQARSRESVNHAEADAARILAVRHDGEQDVTVITQDAILSTFDRILHALTLAVGGIASISLLVAGILVMNVMIVAVSQRREEIGLLKALGATEKTIRAVFLAEGLLLTLVGALAGSVLGTSATFVAAQFTVLGASPPAWALAAAILIAITTGVLFAVAPARRAAQLQPVEALARR